MSETRDTRFGRLRRALSPRRNESFSTVLRAFGYLKPYARHEVLIFVLMLGGVLLSLPQPLAVKLLVDKVFIEGRTSLLSLIMVGLLLAFGLQALLTWYQNYLSNFIYQRVLVDIRHALFDHLQRLTPNYYHNAQTGDVMSRILNDTVSLSTLIATVLSRVLTDALTLLAILALMFMFDWKLSLLSMLVLPGFIITIVKFNKRVRGANAQIIWQRSRISAFLQEAVTMLKLTQMFTREGHMSERFLTRADKFSEANMNATMTSTAANLVAGFFIFLGPLVVLWYGGLLVINKALTIGSLIAFYSYLGRVYGPMNSLASVNMEVQAALAGIARVFQLLDTTPSVHESSHPTVIERVRGEIEFRNVSFSYPGRPEVLKGISFRIAEGSRIAIVGPSGAGKSTIIDLLYRFYDPAEGGIYLDGCDLKELGIGFLRRQISIVSQDTLLFDTTIYENLAFGKEGVSREDVEEAARIANIHDFIAGLPKGYETIIGERGVKLSGGQKQRIAIARALLRNSRIIVLDEATSSLDSIGERKIQAALEHLITGKTVIIIAHRLSTIQDVERIFALNDGVIIAEGTHPELLQASDLYKDLYAKQFNPEPALL